MKLQNLRYSVLLIIISSLIFGQSYKPYILASISDESMVEVAEQVKSNLLTSGFGILGVYSPAEDLNRQVFVITNDDLKNIVLDIGGLQGFAAVLRVAITDEEDGINISYTNPIYWGNAYLGGKYDQAQEVYSEISTKLKNALSTIGTAKGIEFGSEKGISASKLQKYRYMIGMERFDDVVKLHEFDNFDSAIKTIDENLTNSDNLVYSVEFPDKKLKLYGIAIGGEKGENHFLPIIDITTPKHSAFLPYELLVIDKKAVMLHGRYRIALSFPDLTMMTFSKIMSTPGDIKEELKEYTK